MGKPTTRVGVKVSHYYFHLKYFLIYIGILLLAEVLGFVLDVSCPYFASHLDFILLTIIQSNMGLLKVGTLLYDCFNGSIRLRVCRQCKKWTKSNTRLLLLRRMGFASGFTRLILRRRNHPLQEFNSETSWRKRIFKSGSAVSSENPEKRRHLIRLVILMSSQDHNPIS
jgi:hypothetical protein